MDLKRILVAINSPSSRDAAFERALALARSSDAELYVLHAVPANSRYSFRASERLERMADVRARAADAGVRIHTVEQQGDAAAIIELHASARDVDLIVMGGAPRRSWFGRRSSIAEKIIRRTHVPTLVVGGSSSAGPVPFRRVLVGLDLSPTSKEVLDGAIALTAGDPARLTVMHTVKGIEAADAVQTPGRWKVPEYRGHVIDDARQTLETIASAVPPRIDTEVRVATGSAARTILDRAAGADADLIVIGRSRGFSVLGSTALRVLRGNDRALLVVPGADARERQRAA
jgi:nucleotide-binding universal stress UspA family protein